MTGDVKHLFMCCLFLVKIPIQIFCRFFNLAWNSVLIVELWEFFTRTCEKTWGWWTCSLCWLWWWFHICKHTSKVMSLYIFKQSMPITSRRKERLCILVILYIYSKEGNLVNWNNNFKLIWNGYSNNWFTLILRLKSCVSLNIAICKIGQFVNFTKFIRNSLVLKKYLFVKSTN